MLQYWYHCISMAQDVSKLSEGFAHAAGPFLVGACLGDCWGSQSRKLFVQMYRRLRIYFRSCLKLRVGGKCLVAAVLAVQFFSSIFPERY